MSSKMSLELKKMARPRERLVPRQLKLNGKDIPPSIPLAYPDDCLYVPEEFRIEDTPGKKAGEKEPHRLVVAAEAIQLLESIQKPVAVVSICGPYRTGKSYFLSRVLGRRGGVFKTGHTMNGCTRGIWLSTNILECDEFSILFLDSEGADAAGKGETSENFITSILTLTTLLSSLVIYNSKEVPKKDDLRRMRYFSKFAESILVKGMPLKDPKQYFPEFVWLLRDVDLDIVDEEDGETIISPTAYVTKYVLGREDDADGKILDLFPNFKCLKFCPPSGDCKELHKFDDERSPFNEDVRHAIDYIISHVKTKKGHNTGVAITGSSLAILTDHYAKALNTPDVFPDLERGWAAVIEHELANTVESLVEEYTHEMSEKVMAILPMKEVSLLEVHDEVLKLKQEKLRAKIMPLMSNRKTTDTGTYKTHALKLATRIAKFKIDANCRSVESGELFRFMMENKKKSLEQCKSLFLELKKSNLTLKQLLDRYEKEAVGPAKKDIYDQSISKIPGKPENISVHHKSHNTIEIKWFPSKIHRGCEKEYHAQQCLDISNDKWGPPQTTSAFRFKFDNLKSAYRFRFRVCAVNEFNKSDCAIIDVSTLSGPPNHPRNIQIEVVDCLKAKLTCRSPRKGDNNGSPIKKMVVRIFTINTKLSEQEFELSTEKEEYISVDLSLPNIQSSDLIYVSVFWSNSVGLSTASNPFLLKTYELVPGPPQNLRTVGRTHKVIKIRYDPPEVAVDRYVILLQKKDEGSEELKKTKHHSLRAAGLKSNTRYTFTVYATNKCGNCRCTKLECETKLHPAAAGLAGATAAGVGVAGAPLAGAAIVPVASAIGLHEGIKEKSAGKIIGGTLGLISTPITASLGFLGGLITAPVGGVAGGVAAHAMFKDSDNDLEDSDNDDVSF